MVARSEREVVPKIDKQTKTGMLKIKTELQRLSCEKLTLPMTESAVLNKIIINFTRDLRMPFIQFKFEKEIKKELSEQKTA